MKCNEIITEKNYRGPFYHFTSPGNIVGILTKEKFLLSKSSGSMEHRLQKSFKRFDYPYYLSITRTTTSSARTVGLLVLNSEFFYNKREFKPEAVDWFSEYDSELIGGGEAEERVWSKIKTVSYKCIREVHMYTGKDFVLSYPYNNSKYENFIRAERAAKEKGIPCYTYVNDRKAYIALAKHRAIQNFEKLLYNQPQNSNSSQDEENHKSAMTAMNDMILGKQE